MTLESIINELKQWPTCANVSPKYLANALEVLQQESPVKYIGKFSSTVQAEAAAAKIQYAADRNAHILVFNFINGTNITGVIFQTIVSNVCSQTYQSGMQRAYRCITFTDNSLTTIREVGDWVKT